MKKYFIKTFGCQMNESDSQRIASFLEKQKYINSDRMENADIIVVNACSVRQTAIDRIFGLNKKFKNLKAKKILTGCIIKSDIPQFKKFFDEVKDINAFLGKKYLAISPKCQTQTTAYLPIMTGCDNYCSYCVVPFTRGREYSRPLQEIVVEFKKLLKQGYKEIILLGQNVNSYKFGFAKLLKILNKIDGNFKIKFLTNHPKDMSDELIDAIAKCEKIEKEIHLPVQSGDNKILKKMNRRYNIEEYKKLVAKIRKRIPCITITTDVIVGFPNETEKQFQNTVKLFKEIKFDLAYVNKYSHRKGTAAYILKDNIPLVEKQRRWKILNDLTNRHEKQKIIVVLGPTASGKSNLAIQIAKLYNGEIVSADSRQIYKGMDIGTGKIKKIEMKNIPHYLLDIISPKKQYSVVEYKNSAFSAIAKIQKNGKIPIICGGTGFYVHAIINNTDMPEVAPDWKLRKELENKTAEKLFEQLKKLDPNRAQNIDAKNKRRLIRAIEIIKKTGKQIPVLENRSKFDVLYLGIKKSLPEIKKSINRRVDLMFKIGLEKEVKELIKKYGWTIVLKNTIGYAEFQNENPKERIKTDTFKFAKRQLTWFKKYPGDKIHWISNNKETEKLIKEFLFQ